MAEKERKVIQVNLMLACMFEAIVTLKATLFRKGGMVCKEYRYQNLLFYINPMHYLNLSMPRLNLGEINTVSQGSSVIIFLKNIFIIATDNTVILGVYLIETCTIDNPCKNCKYWVVFYCEQQTVAVSVGWLKYCKTEIKQKTYLHWTSLCRWLYSIEKYRPCQLCYSWTNRVYRRPWTTRWTRTNRLQRSTWEERLWWKARSNG